MNGKMRDGSMLRIAPLQNTNRKITARLPVQNAIGNPNMSSNASEPNSRIVSQPMPISMPMAHAAFLVTSMMSLSSLETPCSTISAAPTGMVSLIGQYSTPHSENESSPTETESMANRTVSNSRVTATMQQNTRVT